MKRLLIVLVLVALTTNAHSQDYLISFEGSGDTTIVDSVLVQNLTQGTSLIVDGNDQLRLVENVTGINPVRDNRDNILCIYPNPVKEYCTVKFETPRSDFIAIEVSDILGKKILQESKYFEKGTHLLQISGLGSGVYNLNVKSSGFNYTGKIVSQSNTRGSAQISYTGQIDKTSGLTRLKSENTEVQMQYDSGDRLTLTGISGNYSTVVVDIPTESKTISFNFISCADKDGNNYTIVETGTQTWMAENLKTTHFANGVEIPLVENNSSWNDLTYTSIAYCYYDNLSSNKNTYGAIYTWNAAMNGAASSGNNPSGVQGVCPTGWHLPGDAEWKELVDYMGGVSVAGGKMKEVGTTLWDSPNNGATNESGFTALPGGYRNTNGDCIMLGNSAWFWSATRDGLAMCYGLKYDLTDAERTTYNRSGGFSVRCVKDK